MIQSNPKVTLQLTPNYPASPPKQRSYGQNRGKDHQKRLRTINQALSHEAFCRILTATALHTGFHSFRLVMQAFFMIQWVTVMLA